MSPRPGPDREQEQSERDRRRRLSDAFAEALPETTSDESGDPWGEGRDAAFSGCRDEAWYRSQVPPHHG